MKFVTIAQHGERSPTAMPFDSFEEARDHMAGLVRDDARVHASTKEELTRGIAVAEEIHAQTECPFTVKVEGNRFVSFYSVVKLRGE